MSDSAPVRSSQRTVRACTACVHRKIRCSKTVPCTTCIRQNKAASCHREPVEVVTRRAAPLRGLQQKRKSSSPVLSAPSLATNNLRQATPVTLTTDLAEPSLSPPTPDPNVVPPATSQARPEIANQTPMQPLTKIPTSESRLTNETAPALEFLTHGRRNVINLFAGREPLDNSHSTPYAPVVDETPGEQWDIVLPIEDARMLLALHQAHLTWVHNVVHLPTFRQEFDSNVLHKECDKSWIALYYALLSQTLYHIDSAYLSSLPQPIIVTRQMSRVLFDRSTEILVQSRFMDEHKLTSVQAICLLLQVAHNFDKSDLICVLISTAIRISQCLNLHRLGPNRSQVSTMATDDGVQHLVDREIHKRVWWFLVRYDWFQIPFQNTCQIHPAQFNTPMPANCYDDVQRMIKDGAVVSQQDDICTSNSWTNCLNRLSVLVWKHQERMFKVGYPGDDPDKILGLYDQVLWADQEIKRLYASLPLPLREGNETSPERPISDSFPVGLMPAMVLICTAHKILTVHRHFQLSAFRDRRFAFSQLSCIGIAERSMEAIERWPDTLETRIARRMWTTLTHVISCSITLVFALLFEARNNLTYDLKRIRHYVDFGTEFISQQDHSSSIARRGSRLLSALMNVEQCSHESVDLEADIGDIVRRFAIANGDSIEMHSIEAFQAIFPYEQDAWESYIGDVIAER